ncbi:unnamed protein product [Penicillium nalgiovense]|nr:unnamed protein product [Penicillium nalgiovense]
MPVHNPLLLKVQRYWLSSFFTGFNEEVLSLIPRYPQEERQLVSITYGLITAALA